MYHYRPASSVSEKISLDIDWGKIEGGLTPYFLKQYDYYEKDSPGMTSSSKNSKMPYWFWEMSFIQEEIPRVSPEFEGEAIEFIATKRIHEYKDGSPGDDTLQLGLKRRCSEMSLIPSTDHQYVADFNFVRTEKNGYEEWDMEHRRTSEIYRDQGIASHMIGITERYLQVRAKEKQLPQILTATVGQVDILIWLLNNGFTAATPEDQENIERVFHGDPNLIIVSGASEEGKKSRKWYIFERKKYYDENGRQKPGIWARKNYKKPIHYLKSSLRIKLKKEFKP